MTTELKLIVAGSRSFTDYALMCRVLIAMADVEFADVAISIVSGTAKGADALAIRFANEHNVRLYQFPANWYPNGRLDRGAGYRRNAEMGNFSDGLLAFWDGQSNGTKHMIDYMRKLNKPVHINNFNS